MKKINTVELPLLTAKVLCNLIVVNHGKMRRLVRDRHIRQPFLIGNVERWSPSDARNYLEDLGNRGLLTPAQETALTGLIHAPGERV